MVIMPVHVNIMHIFDAPIAEMESETDSQSSASDRSGCVQCHSAAICILIRDKRYSLDTCIYSTVTYFLIFKSHTERLHRGPEFFCN